ncbi:carotenoid biosynthesis protein [Euhalothece natronophila Z-M001]|uniref:Carotenoid biosynthesis protein n=1 Tax=Euhalothece natronophila Z-M001 TaxID=522448 RepID=A0A5B8NPR8_9CHRO|nr:carotenoid biosynthesis protein [Euhalothece natronophila]QDZ40997.1 carotenoid biosynthesis protein [Euhalothece natronophila Z-M001]
MNIKQEAKNLSPATILLISHLFAMLFGVAGLVLVLPNPDFVASLPPIGMKAFEYSMAGGGVVYMLLGFGAVAFYAYQNLGGKRWLTFMVPALSLSLASELLGTSTGFPFGHYHYLSGLGYKIADLVPFTIPLSWFYVGFCTYLIARVGLEQIALPSWIRSLSAIALGSLLLTFWDFVLDPAMSQADVPFWVWEQPGAFFGMPYQNFIGWFITGMIFMGVAHLFWSNEPLGLARRDLTFPFAIYFSNILFGVILSLAAGIWIPVVLGIVFAIIPCSVLYWVTPTVAITSNTDSQSLSDKQSVSVG